MKAMNVRFLAPRLGASLTAAVLVTGMVRSIPAAAPAAQPQTLKGAVERFNYSPKGEYESLMLASEGKSIQINFPPHLSAKIAKAVAVGDSISVTATTTESKGDHPVYDLLSLSPKTGEEIVAPPPHAKPEPKPEPKPAVTIEGVVRYLNYAHHGEVNGAVLDSGDFVHLGPHEAEAVKLAVGQRLVVKGAAETTADGHKVMEHPVNFNGVEIPHGPPAPKSDPGKKPPVPGRGAP